MTFDELVYTLLTNGVNIDPLADTNPVTEHPYGVRLRFYGNKWPEDKMVLGRGESLEHALHEAAVKLRDGRLEKLNWRARPWPTRESDSSGPFLNEL